MATQQEVPLTAAASGAPMDDTDDDEPTSSLECVYFEEEDMWIETDEYIQTWASGSTQIRISPAAEGGVTQEREAFMHVTESAALELPADPAAAAATAQAFVRACGASLQALDLLLPSHTASDQAVVELFHTIKALLDGLPQLTELSVRRGLWNHGPGNAAPCFPALVAALYAAKAFGKAARALHLHAQAAEDAAADARLAAADPSLLLGRASLPSLTELEVDVPLSESWVGALAEGIANQRMPSLEQLHLRGGGRPSTAAAAAASPLWVSTRPLLQLAAALGGGGAPRLHAFTLANADVGSLWESCLTAGAAPTVNTGFGLLAEALASGAPRLRTLSFAGCGFGAGRGGGGEGEGGAGAAIMGSLCTAVPRMHALRSLSLSRVSGVGEDGLQMLRSALALRSAAAAAASASGAPPTLHMLDLGGTVWATDASRDLFAPYVHAIKY